jgi:protoheme ferro-lyase
MRRTRHVVLATYGEPPSPTFTSQLAYSWRILIGLTRKVDAIPRPLLPVIATARAFGRRRLWRTHGYSSPLEPVTRRKAGVLRRKLAIAAPAVDWRVHVAYEYRTPLVADVLRRLPDDEPVWVASLYAADSAFTHQLSREAAARRRGATYVLGELAPQVLGALSADHVRALTADPAWHGPDVALALAAHGTVLDPPTPIDTGLESTEALCRDIADRLRSRFGFVVNGWLNHTRGGRWTEPPIEEALAAVERAGFRRVVYFPYGFLGDNAESELEGRLALANTSLTPLHLPCPNDSPALVDALVRQIEACSSVCAPSIPTGERREDAGCARLCQIRQAAPCALCAGR